MWIAFAFLSALFAGLTAILGKAGISGVESNLGTAIRTGVVLVMAWGMVFVTGKQKELLQIEKKELGFICLSGLATGALGCVIIRRCRTAPPVLWCRSTSSAFLLPLLFLSLYFGKS